MPTLYSVGHSTRTADEFIELLTGAGVRRLADVRKIPASRRHPQFGAEPLRARAAQDGIEYRHVPPLGGLRRPMTDSPNAGWTHPAFRGYADYMRTPSFDAGLELLLEFAGESVTAFMCAEALWWRCHRRLIADALVARGLAVRHLLSATEAPEHTLTPFARVVEGRLVYPGLF